MHQSISIQTLTINDLSKMKELISLFHNVFEMTPSPVPDDTHLFKLLANKHFLAIAALHDTRIIGGLTLYILEQYYSLKPLAYIYDLAVLPSFQRKGIGKGLIDFTKRYCKEQGFDEAYVQADKPDDYALDFYRQTNPSLEAEVVHFAYNLKSNL